MIPVIQYYGKDYRDDKKKNGGSGGSREAVESKKKTPTQNCIVGIFRVVKVFSDMVRWTHDIMHLSKPRIWGFIAKGARLYENSFKNNLGNQGIPGWTAECHKRI